MIILGTAKAQAGKEVNNMAVWSIGTWEDVGGPEDGIIVRTGRLYVEAETAEQALAQAQKDGFTTTYKYEEGFEYSRGIPDVRPATPKEIEEYEHWKIVDEEYEQFYGCPAADWEEE